MLLVSGRCRANWNDWWTYDGISGASYWGYVNPAWSLCSRGRRQSPVDVDPGRLVYDHLLGTVSIDKKGVAGVLKNTGQSLHFQVEEDDDDDRARSDNVINITGGPLAYR